ncbi:NAD(P)-dependent alcohol dehydrogenase [Actinokineospora sp. UTMC 2448]|uniref:NAD(P)-dependent alcohol dehydrogenase n=1 Tax=Actinokineospora sp. UTMC 2448 TaxID=2268449 RepID=UPI0021644B20|nr:NAD(P)-dependent alcohol dehydrogenase [Actinokineospora sp. UTMC 2448]UVS81049.1 Alcohol dehydrogenase [Actinokineospora sp. UTMC 2448]
MKAIRFDRYGAAEVLRLAEVPVPGEDEGEVLVRVRAAGLNAADLHILNGVPYVMRPFQLGMRPRVGGVGSDFAGQVEAVGRGVTAVRPGDEVYGRVDQRGILPAMGAVAEYVRVSADSVRLRPAGLSAVEAAAVPLAGATALQAMRDVREGQRVLVNGAAGGVGSFAVQIAKARGAWVTGVCGRDKVAMVRSLGADEVVDRAAEDATRLRPGFHLVLDNGGDHSPSAWRRVLLPGATYLASFGRRQDVWLGPLGRLLRMMALNLVVNQRLAPLVAKPSGADLDALTRLIEDGHVRPAVDRVFPLADTPAAVAHLAGGTARGKVVVAVEEG